MSAAQQRKVQRAIHLTTGLLIVAYVYAPHETQVQDAVRFLILPLLVLTGIAMWQAPRKRRLRKTLSRTRRLGLPSPAQPGREG